MTTIECRCTDEVCFEEECRVCAVLDSELPCPAEEPEPCECCDGPGFGQGEHHHGPLCEHPCCPDGDLEPVRSCANCGCTDDRACEGGCWWATAELCSACVPAPGNR